MSPARLTSDCHHRAAASRGAGGREVMAIRFSRKRLIKPRQKPIVRLARFKTLFQVHLLAGKKAGAQATFGRKP